MFYLPEIYNLNVDVAVDTRSSNKSSTRKQIASTRKNKRRWKNNGTRFFCECENCRCGDKKWVSIFFVSLCIQSRFVFEARRERSCVWEGIPVTNAIDNSFAYFSPAFLYITTSRTFPSLVYFFSSTPKQRARRNFWAQILSADFPRRCSYKMTFDFFPVIRETKNFSVDFFSRDLGDVRGWKDDSWRENDLRNNFVVSFLRSSSQL